MKSNLISKSETNAILDVISTEWKIEIPATRNLMMHQLNDDVILVKSEDFTALKVSGSYIPFLSNVEMLKKFPSVTVDMGAVKFVCKGANVMRPGITKFDEYKKDQLVCITEESLHKFLSVGRAIVSSEDAQGMEKGEVVKNIHYISDKYWEIAKEI